MNSEDRPSLVPITHLALRDALARVDEHWRPRLVGVLNGQAVKLAKFQGEFVWHRHEQADELFLVLRGAFRMDFRDRSIEVAEGELLIVPRGIEHRPVAVDEAEVLLFEPLGTLNTGNVIDDTLTAPTDAPL